MRNNILLVSLLLVLTFGQVQAQTTMEELKRRLPSPDSTLLDIRTTKFPHFKKLVMTPIPGAPILSQPQRIDGTKQEIRTEKHGLCYPAFYDWNGDGKPDLLLGEFNIGYQFIKVYENKGTRKKPKFTGEWYYAKDLNGDTIRIHSWCCIGFHLQFVDINKDGYIDIVSGEYSPGRVYWWQGSKNGFLPKQYIEQEGLPLVEDGKEFEQITPEEFLFSSIRMADINGDGLPDLLVGGNNGKRVALNVGTLEKPRFGKRTPLYFIDGTTLSSKIRDSHDYLTPVDWDGDGVTDLLVTGGYLQKQAAVYFLRGRQTSEGLRFELPIPLFEAEDGEKALPGCAPMISVVDWNNDGVNDLLIGLSVETLYEFEGAEEVYWKWKKEHGLPFPGKDAGTRVRDYGLQKTLEQIQQYSPDWNIFTGKMKDLKYLTLRHRGYPIILLGKKNPVKAIKTKSLTVTSSQEQEKDIFISGNPISVKVNHEINDDIIKVNIHFDMPPRYHLYAQSEENRFNRPVEITFDLPKGVERIGKLKCPESMSSPTGEIYKGEHLDFEQVLHIKILESQTLKIKVKVCYQTCNDDSCLQPQEEEHIIEIKL